MSNLLCHSVSFVFLAMLNCSNSVLVRGVYIDAEEPAGQCVIFPVYYIRLFFQRERVKKQRRMLDSVEKGEQHAELLEKSEKIVKTSIPTTEIIDHDGSIIVNNVNGEHKISQ